MSFCFTTPVPYVMRICNSLFRGNETVIKISNMIEQQYVSSQVYIHIIEPKEWLENSGKLFLTITFLQNLLDILRKEVVNAPSNRKMDHSRNQKLSR